jgi:uncharacterized protein with ATP-grasp and redox domains
MVDRKMKNLLPEPLRASDIPSYANFSVITRLPQIGRRVLDENKLESDQTARIQALLSEIPSGRVRGLDNPLDPHKDAAAEFIRPYLGMDWLQTPWFFAEVYFYHRILEGTGYFRPGPGQGIDPFGLQKRLGIETSQTAAASLCEKVDASVVSGAWDEAVFRGLLAIDLWGNQVDLSLWPASQGHETGAEVFAARAEQALVDDSSWVGKYVSGLSEESQVDFILDNAGFELVTDLCLLDLLLATGRVGKVVVHVKVQPTFVSDAMEKDVRAAISFLARAENTSIRAVGGRLAQAVIDGRFLLRADPFWTTSLPMWDAPDVLVAALSHSSLLVFKGDANYRRLLGDRHWPFETPFGQIVDYLPAPVLALRTIKSEVAAGLAPELARRAAAQDQQWMIDGQWGMIQSTGLI